MTAWLLTWACAEPLQAVCFGVALVFSVLAVCYAVGVYRAMRAEMAEDWTTDGGLRR